MAVVATSKFLPNFPPRKSFSTDYQIPGRRHSMKKSGLFAASVAAATASALSAPPSSTTSSSSFLKTSFSHQEKKEEGESSSSRRPPSTIKDQFAPRFDGLRFIETLVTAHR